MKKYPIGIQDFRELQRGEFLYIDKTEVIFQLIESGKYYFLSRPRRFGKSLLVSSLKYLFQGEQELFKGLWIEGKYDFPAHPVLHFSFSALGYKDIGLEAGLHFEQKQEAFFHAVLHLAFSGVGLLVQSEVSTAKGRVDTVVHTKSRIYVMEFKLDGSAASTLQQIREKRYGSPFLEQDKEVIALGVNFSSSEKAVAEWEAVPYKTLLVEG